MQLKRLIPIQSGIFQKLLTTFLLVFVPIYIISSLMNKSGVDIIRQQVYYLMEQKSEFIVSSMDSELNRISLLQASFLDDTDLQDISFRSESLSVYERTRAIETLQDKLQTLSSSSRYIAETFVLLPTINSRLSSKDGFSELGQVDMDTFFHNGSIVSGIVRSNGELFMAYGFPSAMNSKYSLIVKLSVATISEELSKLNKVEDGIAYISGLVKGDSFIIPPANATTEQSDFIARSASIGDARFAVDGKTFIRFMRPYQLAHWTLVIAAQEDKILQPVNSFKTWIWVLSSISVIVVVIVSLSLLRNVHRPLLNLIRAFRTVELGNFDIRLQHKANDEFGYLYKQFNQTVNRLKVLVQEVYEQKIHSQEAELKQLQSQINPHFLYNSLYILYRMAEEENYEGVSSMSEHLGDYYKFITQNKSDFVPLDQEIAHAQAYCSIQQLRFGNRIRFRFESDGSPEGWQVPRLIIQPFLENAIVHGHEDTMKNGWVHVNITVNAAGLTIAIEDNGRGMPPERLAEWGRQLDQQNDRFGDHAVWNVHRRLRLRYGTSSGIEMKTNEHGGLTVRITVVPEGEDKYEQRTAGR